MKTAADKLNKSALAIEEAQEDIREIIKNAYLRNEKRGDTEVKVNKAVFKATKDIKIERLRGDTAKSLFLFATAQLRLWKSLNIPPFILLFLGVQASKGFTAENISATQEKAVLTALEPLKLKAYGVPLGKYYKDVWEENVLPALEKIAQSKALDPNDFTGRNSLRNLAEMEVRYKDHLDSIDNLKSKGVKLVIASTHADCSQRCMPWQGRIFSLDGSYGTIDGRKYVPLENATDIFYTTKAGRTYKNGLLGFNCRHKLDEYTGQRYTRVSEEISRKEYAITLKQRAMEREIRNKRAEAATLKTISNQEYLSLRKKVNAMYEEYKRFSRENERAFYPMRTRI